MKEMLSNVIAVSGLDNIPYSGEQWHAPQLFVSVSWLGSRETEVSFLI